MGVAADIGVDKPCENDVWRAPNGNEAGVAGLIDQCCIGVLAGDFISALLDC